MQMPLLSNSRMAKRRKYSLQVFVHQGNFKVFQQWSSKKPRASFYLIFSPTECALSEVCLRGMQRSITGNLRGRCVHRSLFESQNCKEASIITMKHTEDDSNRDLPSFCNGLMASNLAMVILYRFSDVSTQTYIPTYPWTFP